MSDDKLTEAVDVVAHQMVYMALSAFLDDGAAEHLPELGEFDLERVEERISQVAFLYGPAVEEYQAAYAFLESRAEK